MKKKNIGYASDQKAIPRNGKGKGNKMEKELNELWENLVEYGIATEEELQLVTDINGYSIDTLNSVLYARTAYHNWEQFTEFEGVEK